MSSIRVCAVMAIIAGLLAGFSTAYFHHLNYHVAPIPGVMNRTEAIRLAIPLCRALGDDTDARLSLRSEYSPGWWPDGSTLPTWDIHACDVSGQFVTFLRLDAQTGRVLVASHPTRKRLWSSKSGLDSNEAVTAARRCLARLEIDRYERVWRLASVPKRNNNTWMVVFRTPERKALVKVDGLSGDLVWLSEHPFRSHVASSTESTLPDDNGRPADR